MSSWRRRKKKEKRKVARCRLVTKCFGEKKEDGGTRRENGLKRVRIVRPKEKTWFLKVKGNERKNDQQAKQCERFVVRMQREREKRRIVHEGRKTFKHDLFSPSLRAHPTH